MRRKIYRRDSVNALNKNEITDIIEHLDDIRSIVRDIKKYRIQNPNQVKAGMTIVSMRLVEQIRNLVRIRNKIND
jgi:hypothetical protein